MSSILKTVLSKDKDIEKATSSYVDDICVNTDIVSSEYVIDHLNRYGLVAKAPEQLDGGSALGLKIQKNKEGVLMYHRANELPEVIPDKLTKKELFSITNMIDYCEKENILVNNLRSESINGITEKYDWDFVTSQYLKVFKTF